MTALRQGRIVYVPLLDPQGRNPKTRPAVVITPTDQIAADGLVRVVAITSQCGVAPQAVAVALPWHRDGHPRTKLRRPSEAVCTWSGFVPADQVADAGGFVPAPQFKQVLQILDVLDNPPQPPDPPPVAAPPSAP